MAKLELHYFDTEEIPWRPIEDRPGQYEKILSKDPQTGSFTRLLYCQPDFEKCIKSNGKYLEKNWCHEDMWEEVFIVSGMSFDITLNKTSKAGYYACRPPGMKHGPFLHPVGGVFFEVMRKIE